MRGHQCIIKAIGGLAGKRSAEIGVLSVGNGYMAGMETKEHRIPYRFIFPDQRQQAVALHIIGNRNSEEIQKCDRQIQRAGQTTAPLSMAAADRVVDE